jgi:hypothetical protein
MSRAEFTEKVHNLFPPASACPNSFSRLPGEMMFNLPDFPPAAPEKADKTAKT